MSFCYCSKLPHLLLRYACTGSSGLRHVQLGDVGYLCQIVRQYLHYCVLTGLLINISQSDDESHETHMEVFLSVNKHKTPFKLVRLMLDYGKELLVETQALDAVVIYSKSTILQHMYAGLHLFVVCKKDADMDTVHPVIESSATRVQHILEVG